MADDGEKRPHIRLAAENDRKSVDKARARYEIEWPLRRLAANIMRVSRGAGEPYSVIQQCIDVVKGAQAFCDKCGDWPDDNEVREALDFHDPRLRDYTKPHDERSSAIEDIVEGALRLAAGRLLRQDLQERHGEKDLLEGIRRLDHYHAEIRAKWEAERRARAPSRTAPKRKKPIRKPKL
ncbi:MAG: hypothetical protein E5X48_11115 [Mesorhizobium sp.]|uniref:hypothetical protein n=1 Tax=Mesorhizobium sp. TaxID=1871066 RepID=UPI0012056B0C|nr:hypothetical protein [Mesorhizobium sp.]TIQ35967.1 MAG: hypothetical protein E5X48_11115 [Mesorhizobium sp.]